jgi:hypothetical protein
MKWMRHEFMRPVEHKDPETGEYVGHAFFLRALRNDGQMFETHHLDPMWRFADDRQRARLLLAIHAYLATFMNTLIDDPAMPPQTAEDGEVYVPQVHPGAFAGTGDWIEGAP